MPDHRNPENPQTREVASRTHQTSKWQFADKQLRGSLVSSDFAKSHRSRAVAVLRPGLLYRCLVRRLLGGFYSLLGSVRRHPLRFFMHSAQLRGPPSHTSRQSNAARGPLRTGGQKPPTSPDQTASVGSKVGVLCIHPNRIRAKDGGKSQPPVCASGYVCWVHHLLTCQDDVPTPMAGDFESSGSSL